MDPPLPADIMYAPQVVQTAMPYQPMPQYVAQSGGNKTWAIVCLVILLVVLAIGGFIYWRRWKRGRIGAPVRNLNVPGR